MMENESQWYVRMIPFERLMAYFVLFNLRPPSLGAFMFLTGSLYLQFIFDFLTFYTFIQNVVIYIFRNLLQKETHFFIFYI